MQHTVLDDIIHAWLSENLLTKQDFHKLKNTVYKRYNWKKPFTNIQIIERYNELVKEGSIEHSPTFQKIIRKRDVRSLSGVTVISLLTKQFFCPGKCVYCPTFEWLPKSYIPNEPAVQRAQLNDFDPILQIHNRLRALEITGHAIEKNDVRIIGGTWSVYPKSYRDEFIKEIYDAFNTYDEMKDAIESTDLSSDSFAIFKLKAGYGLKKSATLEEAKRKNETARCRVIGMAIETRPDWVTNKEIALLREYGVTRVEIGYQTTIDEINIANKRGHTNAESIRATRKLKNAGFKVVAHMMPNLLGSTPDLDRQALQEVFDNPDFRPDELKIYPMVVTDNSELTEIWRNGWFTPYDDETLIDLTADLEAMIPEYVRLNRTYRDIPASEILAGSHLSNLRQLVEERLVQRGVKMIDIRHRELKDKKNNPQNAVLRVCEYDASGGMEYFLTFEDPDDRTIFSLLRLRLPSKDVSDEVYEVLPEIRWGAMIREIHTFGDQVKIGESGGDFGQHIGFGKRLIARAEEISREHGYEKIFVIAGVGVRPYYEKRGYQRVGEYMGKEL